MVSAENSVLYMAKKEFYDILIKSLQQKAESDMSLSWFGLHMDAVASLSLSKCLIIN